jgi:hypothetical protein
MVRPNPASKVLRGLFAVTCGFVCAAAFLIRYVRDPVLPDFANDPVTVIPSSPRVPLPVPSGNATAVHMAAYIKTLIQIQAALEHHNATDAVRDKVVATLNERLVTEKYEAYLAGPKDAAAQKDFDSFASVFIAAELKRRGAAATH